MEEYIILKVYKKKLEKSCFKFLLILKVIGNKEILNLQTERQK